MDVPLFVLVSVFSELLLAFMGRYLPKFAFSSAGHTRLLKAHCLKMKPVNNLQV